MREIPFAYKTSKGESPLNTSETLINLYAEKASGLSNLILKNTPGIEKKVELDTHPILGLTSIDNLLYAVTPKYLYSIDPITKTVTKLGSVSFSDKVTFAYNGNQLVMTSGDSYYYDFTGVYKVTDPNYYPSDTVTFQDGYFIFNRRNTGQFFISGLYSLTFDALDYATAESSPDDLKAVKSDSKKLWLFGNKTIEVWYNSGDTFPFTRLQGGVINTGIYDKSTIQLVGNVLVFVGNDGIVYGIDGFTPVRLSTSGVENDIADSTKIDSTSYSYKGHSFYALHLDDKTLVFDLSTHLWHTRQSLDTKWKVSYIEPIGDNFYSSDKDTGYIYRLAEDIYKDDEDNIKREVITIPITNEGNYFTVSEFEILMETGKVLPEDDKNIYLQYSENGIDWSNIKDQDLGNVGERDKKVKWYRLGRHKEIMFKVFSYAPVPFRILKAYGTLR